MCFFTITRAIHHRVVGKIKGGEWWERRSKTGNRQKRI